MTDFNKVRFNRENFRNEVKYKFYTTNISKWINKISNNQNNFKLHHEARWVNNIYFDTPSFDFFKQSHEGSSPRLKIRLRWYGDFFKTLKAILSLKSNIQTKMQKFHIHIKF